MANFSATLSVGDRAPDFTLLPANRAEAIALSHVLKRGPVMVEFLRGTW